VRADDAADSSLCIVGRIEAALRTPRACATEARGRRSGLTTGVRYRP
jgi:hypothetical protein